MQILNNTLTECDECHNLFEYSEDDIKVRYESYESQLVHSTKITYVDCPYCNKEVVIDTQHISKD